MHDLPPFPGFRAEALAFLRDLRANNDRAWFQRRKALYEDELLWPARCLVAGLAEASRAAGTPLSGNPTKNVFRIYRDTRFSKDKSPYKTHVGVYVTPSGDKSDNGGLYVHVEPGASFVATGHWDPDPRWVGEWRARLAADPAGWRDVRDTMADAAITLSHGPAGALKRLPRGYDDPGDESVAEALRWKGVVATQPVPDDALGPDLVDRAVGFYAVSAPLREWVP